MSRGRSVLVWWFLVLKRGEVWEEFFWWKEIYDGLGRRDVLFSISFGTPMNMPRLTIPMRIMGFLRMLPIETVLREKFKWC